MSTHRTLRVVLVLQMAILAIYTVLYTVYSIHVSDDYGILVEGSPMRTAINAAYLALCTTFGTTHEFVGSTIRSRNIALIHGITNMLFLYWVLHSFSVQRNGGGGDTTTSGGGGGGGTYEVRDPSDDI